MNPRRFLPALFLLFVGSGCAALIYEIVWFQLLQLIIGSSSISLGILLGTFMGGMCLGSLLLSRIISAREHPLRVYAALELAIGVLGVLILFAMPLVGSIYTAWGGEGMFGIVFRAVVAGVCLLPPTVLMGATLPAISRRVHATPDAVSLLGFLSDGNHPASVLAWLPPAPSRLRVPSGSRPARPPCLRDCWRPPPANPRSGSRPRTSSSLPAGCPPLPAACTSRIPQKTVRPRAPAASTARRSRARARS